MLLIQDFLVCLCELNKWTELRYLPAIYFAPRVKLSKAPNWLRHLEVCLIESQWDLDSFLHPAGTMLQSSMFEAVEIRSNPFLPDRLSGPGGTGHEGLTTSAVLPRFVGVQLIARSLLCGVRYKCGLLVQGALFYLSITSALLSGLSSSLVTLSH